MDPATALVLAAAARGFGEGFGKGTAQALFGGGSDDIRSVQKKLKQILSELEEINRRVSYLTQLVSDLPAVIIGEFRRELVDEAYRNLDSSYVVLSRSEVEGRVNPPGEEFASRLLSAWRTVVDLESRPEKLIELPFWTEFLRKRIVINIDSTLKSHLEKKKQALDADISLKTADLDGKYGQARAHLASAYFSDFSIRPDSPYLTHSSAPTRTKKVLRRQSRDEWEWIEVEDTGWTEAMRGAAQTAESFKPPIAKLIGEVGATTQPQLLLGEYIPHLSGGGLIRTGLPWGKADDALNSSLS